MHYSKIVWKESVSVSGKKSNPFNCHSRLYKMNHCKCWIKSLKSAHNVLHKLTAYFVDFFVLSGTAFATGFLMSTSLDSRKRVCFSPCKIKSLLLPFFDRLCFFSTEMISTAFRRANIHANGGYCVITVL